MDEARGIGYENKIPWRLPDDLKRFKQLTMGHHIIMGRLTYESIGKSLPGRTTVVITRNPQYFISDVIVVYSLKNAIQVAEDRGETEAFVIGGGQIFSSAVKLADRIYLTKVHTQLDCDVTFPEFDLNDWQIITQTFHETNSDNQHASTFLILDRIREH